jgi:transposase
LLFVGDDWSEQRHDVELQDEAGRRVGRARLDEGIAGIARLHELIAEQLEEDAAPEQVVVGIETDRGPWVVALVAAGYQVYAINPLQVSRYRERRSVSGAKSDTADAHTLADMVRTDRHQLRQVAGDSDAAESMKVLARAHQRLIWERTRHLLWLRSALREFFPAALAAFGEDLAGADALELLAAAPDPVSAARLSTSRISAALKRARRRQIADKAQAIRAALRTEQLRQPEVITAAYAATVPSEGAGRSLAACAAWCRPVVIAAQHVTAAQHAGEPWQRCWSLLGAGSAPDPLGCPRRVRRMRPRLAGDE